MGFRLVGKTQRVGDFFEAVFYPLAPAIEPLIGQRIKIAAVAQDIDDDLPCNFGFITGDDQLGDDVLGKRDLRGSEGKICVT